MSESSATVGALSETTGPVSDTGVASRDVDIMSTDWHPAADLFPLMSDTEIRGLANDIKMNGLRHHVTIVREGGRYLLIDGRNRVLAHRMLGASPRYVVWEGDAVTFVVSQNLQRMHMDESKRAVVAARLATLKHGANQHAPIGASSQADAAKLLSVSRRNVQRARAVLDSGSPDLVRAVETGAIAVSAAARIASLPEKQRGAALDAATEPAANPRPAASRHREAEVVRLHSEGRNGAEIAETLSIPESTVSYIKSRAGIRTEGKKLAQQIERAIDSLEGVSIQVDALATRLETHDPEMSQEEVLSCSRKATAAAAAARRLSSRLRALLRHS